MDMKSRGRWGGSHLRDKLIFISEFEFHRDFFEIFLIFLHHILE
jgi:hypothetical protein